MPGFYSLSMLPASVWHIILSYLSPADMRQLMLVDHQIRDYVQAYMYSELTLTEWASSGKRLALAIEEGVVSEEAVRCIRTLRIKFTSFEEISETLALCVTIQPRMSGVIRIEVEGHKAEDTLWALKLLLMQYPDTEMEATARAPPLGPMHTTIDGVLERLTTLRIPRLYKSDVAYLASIQNLQVEEIFDDNSMVLLPALRVIERIAMRYRDYAMLGSPSCEHLELMLDRSVTTLRLESPTVFVLRLVATTDLPEVKPVLRMPSLRVLILSNIAPVPTIRLLRNNSFPALEFLSLAPVTIPALQALASAKFLPTLRLLLAMVMRTSYLSDTPQLQKRETRKLVEWLQTIASTCPVDVRDFSHLLKREIYFSEGLWCLAAQTRYREYLPLVAPPPLVIKE